MLTKIIKNPIIIKFFSRPACSLCLDAKDIIYPVVEDFPDGSFKIDEIDIDLNSNKEHHNKFKNDVPVGMIDKKVIFKHRIDEDKLYFDLETILRDQIKKEKDQF